MGWIQAELSSDVHDDLRQISKGSGDISEEIDVEVTEDHGIGEVCADIIEEAVEDVDASEFEEEEEEDEE